MASVTSNAVVTFRGLGRTHSDEDEIFNPAHLAVWDAVPDVLSRRRYELDGTSYDFSIDWRRLAREKRRHAKYTVREWLKLSKVQQDRALRFAGSVKVNVACSIRTPSRATPELTQFDLLRLFLYEVFFVVNLAAPSAFSAAEVAIMGDGVARGSFSLHGLFFEEAWITAIRNGWPDIDFIPLDRVWRWYTGLGLDVKQVATNRISRAVFSILHVADMSAEEPSTLVWVAQCLESVLDIRQAARTATLARVRSLCGAPPDEQYVKKEIERFSTARNKFAHGSAPLLHPLASASLDEAAEEYFENWMEPTFFGSTLVLATLQQYAMRGWREAKWTEENVLESSVPAGTV